MGPNSYICAKEVSPNYGFDLGLRVIVKPRFGSKSYKYPYTTVNLDKLAVDLTI